MARLSPAHKAPVPPVGLKRGCYLQDGVRLWRVLDACDGQVVLEDCRRPDEPACCIGLGEVLRRMKVVKTG